MADITAAVEPYQRAVRALQLRDRAAGNYQAACANARKAMADLGMEVGPKYASEMIGVKMPTISKCMTEFYGHPDERGGRFQGNGRQESQ